MPRRARIEGIYGVMPETASPIVDTSHLDDPIWKRLVVAVQSADQKRGCDISAFWIHSGWDIVVLITALSRPQLQAITDHIKHRMKHELRMKLRSQGRRPDPDLRSDAAAGWVLLPYDRIQIHIMTPTQRSYYNIEGIWR